MNEPTNTTTATTQPVTHESTAHKILAAIGHVVTPENIKLVAGLIIEFEQAKNSADSAAKVKRPSTADGR